MTSIIRRHLIVGKVIGRRKDKDFEFAKAFLASQTAYHNHLAYLCHAILLVELGLPGFVLVILRKIECFLLVNDEYKYIIDLMFVTFCVFVHILLRYQFRYRRISAIRISGLLCYLSSDSKSLNKKIGKNKYEGEKFIDYLIPWNKPYEEIFENAPTEVAQNMHAKIRKNNLKNNLIEWIYWGFDTLLISSIFVLLKMPAIIIAFIGLQLILIPISRLLKSRFKLLDLKKCKYHVIIKRECKAGKKRSKGFTFLFPP